ncbi:protein-tyrosine phosphatase [Kineococcus xinjiangensis]|uniref:protein-tyrosine-phosphatase n=1 Tax=Kineococcus xinjiangensis TaxID=512762 RepID=A0A2S6IV94_9ACTN|nr:low molecular weight protein-tyrosine-phosphatase [Kineococcus xinjiangensis]PPK98128.1 protein-tyrosine phosphatase [Kineococcus xinjiangensis]
MPTTSRHLPAADGEAPYRVCFVCSGNICRSPVAEVVLRALAEEAGLGGRLEVDSAGTGDWHVGEPADRRALASLTAGGYDGSTHRARRFERSWATRRDLLVAMDRGHEADLHAALAGMSGPVAQVRLLSSFVDAGAGERLRAVDVADPYYGGPDGFTAVLAQVEAGCRGILEHVRRELGARAGA